MAIVCLVRGGGDGNFHLAALLGGKTAQKGCSERNIFALN